MKKHSAWNVSVAPWRLRRVALMGICLLWWAAPALSVETPPWKLEMAWQPRKIDGVKAEAFAWLTSVKADPGTAAKAEALWANVPADASEDELLDRLVQTFALAEPRAAELAGVCSGPRSRFRVSPESWLRDQGVAPLMANNLRLFYARWLVQESLFDEALVQLSDLSPGDVVAPAALLFCQSVVHHALLNKESGLKSLGELLQGDSASPRRYVALARLMQNELNDLEDDTLDHIARRMDDIRRRLELGRAGAKVREVQDGVIESLDKLIKKLEDQQQQQQPSGGSNNMQPSSPAEESRIAGGKAPGEVTKKNVGQGSGWGDLPPKEREEAMQQVGREFPPHYRDVIEQYFRRLAAESSEQRKE